MTFCPLRPRVEYITIDLYRAESEFHLPDLQNNFCGYLGNPAALNRIL